MCDPISATLGVVSAGSSIFGARKQNKAANKMARAQAAAAKEQFYLDRVNLEVNADMQLTDIELQATEVERKQAQQEGALLAAVGGGGLVAGQSTSKLIQTSIAEGALNTAAIQGTKDNKRRQIMAGFDANKNNYESNIAQIKSNLNKNYQDSTTVGINALTAGIQGAATGLQISNTMAATKATKAATAASNASTAASFLEMSTLTDNAELSSSYLKIANSLLPTEN